MNLRSGTTELDGLVPLSVEVDLGEPAFGLRSHVDYAIVHSTRHAIIFDGGRRSDVSSRSPELARELWLNQA